MSESAKSLALLVVEAGGQRCGLPLSCVVETLRAVGVRPVARAPEFVAGVALVRGEILPVVELAWLLGRAGPKGGRLVVVRAGERRVALAVGSVPGVRRVAAERLGAAPGLLGAAQAEVVSRLGVLDQQLLLVLRTGRLVPEEVWSSLAQEEVA